MQTFRVCPLRCSLGSSKTPAGNIPSVQWQQRQISTVGGHVARGMEFGHFPNSSAPICRIKRGGLDIDLWAQSVSTLRHLRSRFPMDTRKCGGSRIPKEIADALARISRCRIRIQMAKTAGIPGGLFGFRTRHPHESGLCQQYSFQEKKKSRPTLSCMEVVQQPR